MSTSWYLEGYEKYAGEQIPSPFYRGRAHRVSSNPAGTQGARAVFKADGLDKLSAAPASPSRAWTSTGHGVVIQPFRPPRPLVAGETFVIDYGTAPTCEVSELIRSEAQLSPRIRIGEYFTGGNFVDFRVVFSNATGQMYYRIAPDPTLLLTEADLPVGAFGGHYEIDAVPQSDTVYWIPMGIYVHQQGRAYVEHGVFFNDVSKRFEFEVRVNNITRIAKTTVNYTGVTPPTLGCEVKSFTPGPEMGGFAVDDFYAQVYDYLSAYPTLDDYKWYSGLRVFWEPVEEWDLLLDYDGTSGDPYNIDLIPLLDPPRGWDFQDPINGSETATTSTVAWDNDNVYVPADHIAAPGELLINGSVIKTAEDIITVHIKDNFIANTGTGPANFSVDDHDGDQMILWSISEGDPSATFDVQMSHSVSVAGGEFRSNTKAEYGTMTFNWLSEIIGRQSDWTCSGMEVRTGVVKFDATKFLLGPEILDYSVCTPQGKLPLPVGVQGSQNFGLFGGNTTQIVNNFLDFMKSELQLYVDESGGGSYAQQPLDLNGFKITNLPATASANTDAILSKGEAETIIAGA